MKRTDLRRSTGEVSRHDLTSGPLITRSPIVLG
jgi:hypothetical protein